MGGKTYSQPEQDEAKKQDETKKAEEVVTPPAEEQTKEETKE